MGRVVTRVVALLIGLVALSTSAPAADVSVNLDRALHIRGVIAGRNLDSLAAKMQELAKQDKSKPIDLIIDSPGGSVVTGFLFLNVMRTVQAQGTPVRCFSSTYAASMAFHIFLHCSERHVLGKVLLLWHRARVELGNTPVTAPIAKNLAADLYLVDGTIYTDLVARIPMDEKQISEHFERETLHVASKLDKMAPGFLEVHEQIENLLEANKDKRVLTSQEPFFGFGIWTPGSMVYVWDAGVSK